MGTSALPSSSKHFALQEKSMHKNLLQQYAQKLALSLPSYCTINEGKAHAREFRSTVFIDGVGYSSSRTFARLKEAEQDAARAALETISQKIIGPSCSPFTKDSTFSKSILNEFAVKVNAEKPTYKTIQCKGLLPVFVSTVGFDGKPYKGHPGRNKKEAERHGASAVIESILGTKSGIILYEIIKSKENVYAAVLNEMNRIPESPTPVQTPKKPKLEPTCETSTGLIKKTTLVLDQEPCSQVGPVTTQVVTTIASTSGKKRPHKKKGKKQILVDGRLIDLELLE